MLIFWKKEEDISRYFDPLLHYRTEDSANVSFRVNLISFLIALFLYLTGGVDIVDCTSD